MIIAGLSACSIDDATPLVGTWKDTDNDRYISIAKEEGKFSVVMYAGDANGHPSKRVTLDGNHVLNIKAAMLDGVLTIKTEEGEIPLLLNPLDNNLYINGVDEFRRVTPESIKS